MYIFLHYYRLEFKRDTCTTSLYIYRLYMSQKNPLAGKSCFIFCEICNYSNKCLVYNIRKIYTIRKSREHVLQHIKSFRGWFGPFKTANFDFDQNDHLLR